MTEPTLATHERRKYERIWSDSRYAQYSPGEEMVPLFRQMCRKKGTLLDIGCGTGRATRKLHEAGYSAVGIDFVDARDAPTPFVKQNLWTPWKKIRGVRDYGYCCDVMEHIPPEKVDLVLDNIIRHCNRVFFSVHFGPDHFGQVIGHPLHLTIRPFVWWREKLRCYGILTEARDLLGMGVFLLQTRKSDGAMSSKGK